jgi:hypothetical protein
VQNEPLFLGRPEGYRKAGLLRHGDSPYTGLKGGDSAEGRWVARFAFGEPRGRVEVWRGVAPKLTESTPPHAERELADLRFDRLGVGSGADAAPWRFDEFLVTDNREALVEALAVLSAPVLEAALQPGPTGAPKERRE